MKVENQSPESEREFLDDIKDGKYSKEREERKRVLAFGKALGYGKDGRVMSLQQFALDCERQTSEAFQWLLTNQNKTLEYNYKTYTVLEYFARVDEMSVKSIMDVAILLGV